MSETELGQLTPLQKLTNDLKARVSRYKTKIQASILDDIPPGYHLNLDETPTVQHIQEAGSRFTFSEVLPWESYDPETHLFYNKDTVGFSLIGDPAVGLDLEAINGLNSMLREETRTDTVLQIQLISDPNVEGIVDEWATNKFMSGHSDRQKIFKMLVDNRKEHFSKAKWDSMFDDEPFLIRDLKFVISYIIPNELGDFTQFDEEFLLRTKEAIQSTLQSEGIPTTLLKPSAFINLVGGILNPSLSERPLRAFDPINPLCRQVVEKDTRYIFSAGAGTIDKDGERFSFLPFHAEQYPQQWLGTKNGDFIGDFISSSRRLPFHFSMTMVVVFPDSVSQKGKAKTKSARATQMAGSPASKYNRTFEERRQDWSFVETKTQEGDKIVQACFQINCWVREGNEQEAQEKMKSVFENKGYRLTRTRFMPFQAMMLGLPQGLSCETRKQCQRAKHFPDTLTWNVTNLAPWIGEYKGDDCAVMCFLGRKGQFIYFDPFANKQGNYNMSCCAASGGGKSFFTQEWVFSILGFGGRAYVIDSGGSYENLCELLEGVYIDAGKGNLCFNPFTHCKEAQNDEEEDFFMKDHIPMIKQIIAEMCSPSQPATDSEVAIIERAIMDAWELKKSKSSPTTVWEALVRIAENDPMAEEVASDLQIRLRPYTKFGSFGRFFEGENNIDLSNNFVVLELDSLGEMPALRAVILFIIMMEISRQMYLVGDKSVRKLAIIDEAWKLLGQGNAGSFIEEGFRVARKHGGSFMTITQSPADYYKSAVAKAAYDQSDYSVYLRLKDSSLQASVEMGALSEDLAAVIKTLQTQKGKYSELCIDTPTGFFVGRFVVDPITCLIYDTSPENMQVFKQRRKEGYDVKDTLYEIFNQNEKNRAAKKVASDNIL